ncbi:Vrp1 [Saccharomyces paradoxus]|uniref:Vrp1 n=1 Tax=Saccharomyces paradoxus TaxID=27291 RepID=A0A8B8UWJ6_SACPA|nr:Vrp1 [Saccharomyces paradoxus]QHS75044.1 Vrp1 [Saccharomyces paradoxus]
MAVRLQELQRMVVKLRFLGTFGAEALDNGSGGAADNGALGIGGAAEDGILGIGGAEDGGIPGTAGADDSGALGIGGAATEGIAPGICGAFDDGENLVLASLLTCFNFGIPPAKISPNCGAPIPGTGGADIEGPLLLMVLELPEADETAPPPTIGALLSFVSAFFNFIPFLMSPKRASRPCITDFAGLGALPPPNAGGGGGGGGAGAPAISIIGCK